jgi:DinB superfamily
VAGTVSTAQAQRVVEAERASWETLVAQVGERVDEPGPDPAGDWTFKDLAAHLTAWLNRKLDRMDDPEAPPPWPLETDVDTDTINAWIYRQNRDRPARDVLRDAVAAYDRLRGRVADLPEDDLNDPARFPVLDGASLGDALVHGGFFEHLHEEHGPDIRAWRERAA